MVAVGGVDGARGRARLVQGGGELPRQHRAGATPAGVEDEERRDPLVGRHVERGRLVVKISDPLRGRQGR